MCGLNLPIERCFPAYFKIHPLTPSRIKKKKRKSPQLQIFLNQVGMQIVIADQKSGSLSSSGVATYSLWMSAVRTFFLLPCTASSLFNFHQSRSTLTYEKQRFWWNSCNLIPLLFKITIEKAFKCSLMLDENTAFCFLYLKNWKKKVLT